jgi:hypothetical protein
MFLEVSFEQKKTSPSPVGSYDYVLGSVGLPLYLLDLRQTQQGL